jgi:nucleoside-diphosphate-sugar epimerase
MLPSSRQPSWALWRPHQSAWFLAAASPNNIGLPPLSHRSLDNEAMLAPLRALPGAEQRLKLFAADLLKAGSFHEAVAGCDYVIHTASPFIVNVRGAPSCTDTWGPRA